MMVFADRHKTAWNAYSKTVFAAIWKQLFSNSPSRPWPCHAAEAHCSSLYPLSLDALPRWASVLHQSWSGSSIWSYVRRKVFNSVHVPLGEKSLPFGQIVGITTPCWHNVLLLKDIGFERGLPSLPPCLTIENTDPFPFSIPEVGRLMEEGQMNTFALLPLTIFGVFT